MAKIMFIFLIIMTEIIINIYFNSLFQPNCLLNSLEVTQINMKNEAFLV